MDQQRQMMQQLAMFSNFGAGGLGGGGGRGGGNNLNQFLPLLGGGNNNQNQQTQPTYQSGQPAVLFVSNMIAEEQIDNLDMIWGAEPMRETYEVAALISSFWQDNLELLSDDLISQFNGMTTEEVISSLMKDSRYFSRFGGYSITRYGTELANAPGWKWLEWLGHFNEEKFPWIYHSGLGWMYVHGLTDDQTWFYIPSAGWLGTTKEIWEVMDETSNYLWLYEQSNSRWVAYYLQQPAGKIFWNPQSKIYFTYE